MITYLVDGNNVMAQRVGWHKDKVGARRRLVDELSRFARAEGVPVEVMFDGAPDERFPEGSTYCGVRVYYGAPGSDADTRIKHLVKRWPERHPLVVVTSDRALADYVRRRGVRVIRSGELHRRLEALGEAGAAESPSGARPPRSRPTMNRAASAWPRRRGAPGADRPGEWLR
jgi:predicted RNA-binding protein with PIN domain